MTSGHERPREEWIETPVPALVSEDSFARAQELLEQNKIRSRRRTIEPSIVQGLVSCQKCGYAFARTSTRTSARKIHYYKCIGSDGWRKLGGGPVCNNGRFVRPDLLDPIVWDEVVRLLEDPTLIKQELDRRLEAARSSNPTKKREQSLQRELAQVGKGIERLLRAYQEALVSTEQLRERMPALRQREQTLVLSYRQSLDRPMIERPSCASRKPSRRSSPACVERLIRSVSMNASGSCGL
jgi:site-specific DNA recombinase